MEHCIEEILDALINQITRMQYIDAIGISGTIKPFPEPGKGDFDIFIYCDIIPSEQIRSSHLKALGDKINNIKIGVFNNETWGYSDYCTINGIDTWLMYFNKNDVDKNIEDIKNGKYLDRTDKYYYPVGRLSMFRNLSVLYDKNNFLADLKKRLDVYPKTLKKPMIEHNLEALSDDEDLLRAINRKDVLFYHFALDIALDHFLLALFAINEIFFPSRKRSLQYIEKFDKKPSRCEERLLIIIKKGANADTLMDSYEDFKRLCKELREL